MSRQVVAERAPAKAPVVTYREAVREGIREAMRRDDRVFLMGEDVGRYGGGFGVSMGLLEEFGEERIRDTPLSEAGFVGAGIGAALGGMRPIVEIMTVNFSLLALDQILNSAATMLHMSGGQFNVPLVIRMATGGGRQLAAQHSHSLEGFYAHIPGIRVLAPATVADASDELPVNSHEADIERAMIRRPGDHVTIVTHGGSLRLCLSAAEVLAGEGISAEVVDLRTLRPLDDATILGSVTRTHRALVVDEAWRTGGLSAEVAARIAEECFYDLDAPVGRVAAVEVPIPYPRHLEQAALPSTERIVAEVRRLTGGSGIGRG